MLKYLSAANTAVGDSCNNSLHMSNDVFESADDDEEPDVSSRTVSHDKISTITEVNPRHLSCIVSSNITQYSTQMTENSTSNSEERTRGKLLSTQSEPAASAAPCNGDEDKEAEVNGVTAADEGIHDDTISLKEENGMGFLASFRIICKPTAK